MEGQQMVVDVFRVLLSMCFLRRYEDGGVNLSSFGSGSKKRGPQIHELGFCLGGS